MTSYRWKTSVTNGNWNVDGNWTTSGYPGGGVPETDVAVLPAKLGRIGFYTVTVPASTLIDLLRLAIGGSSGVFHVTNLDVNGILNTDTLAYFGASNHANIDIGVGGKLDIRTTLNSGDPQILTIEATGTGGFGTGGYLQLGSRTLSGFATGLVNANVTFGFHNNPTGINSGVIEYLSGFINGGTVTAAQQVTNLAWGDGFIVDGDNFTGASFVINSGTLHVTTTSSSVINFTHLNLAGLTAANFVGVGDDIEIICYVRGTRILTPQGERAIEALAPGDPVVTATGETLAVKWVGHRRLSLAGHPRPQTVAPVRILRGAVADNMPHRDLLVSPDHALFVDGKLICARQLVNGTTIRQEGDWPTVEYYHVELDRHAIVLAEGLPAESYIDTGNSGFFANADAPLRLHPDLTDESDYPTREAGSCAPFVWDEASVRPVWEGLADRAASIGLPVPQRETTTQAELRLRAKGRLVRPIYADGDLVIFTLPRGARDARLVSRAQPANKARPWLEDRRRLGVRVTRLVLRGAEEVREVPMDHPDLTEGWWAVERDGRAISRWTDGEAVLPLPDRRGDVMLEVHLAGAMTYVVEDAPQRNVGVDYPAESSGSPTLSMKCSVPGQTIGRPRIPSLTGT